jgi:hypothetical protein
MTGITPKPLHSATISYRTPSGRRVLFGSIIASRTLAECRDELCHRLRNEGLYGRRRIATILDDFTPVPIGMQIATR